MSKRISRAAEFLIGSGLVAGLAVLATAFFGGRPQREWLPIAFIVLALLVAMRYGSSAGVAGTLAAAFVFAWMLYLPHGSLRVEDTGARDNIGWLIIGGVALSVLFGRPPREERIGPPASAQQPDTGEVESVRRSPTAVPR
jgi:K+-sensing histidine kinase KdpD